MYGITYNGKHSYKYFGITLLNSRLINTPNKRKVTVTIPFASGSYDFSNLYGSTCFDDRTMEYQFLLKANTVEELETKRIEIENWLLSTNEKTTLEDDILINYYYLAECIGTEFKEINNMGKLTATFTAYPFKIHKESAGNLFWDNFNFDLDALQETTFVVAGTRNITLYNLGAVSIAPTITCTSAMNLTKENTTYSAPKGTAKSDTFELEPGENNITLVGEGTITFDFRKEVL